MMMFALKQGFKTIYCSSEISILTRMVSCAKHDPQVGQMLVTNIYEKFVLVTGPDMI